MAKSGKRVFKENGSVTLERYPPMNLDEKRKQLEQKKARLQKSQALLKAQERKQKLSQKIRIGELAEKAGLLDMDHEVLLGAFFFLKKNIHDKKFISQWKEEAATHKVRKEPKEEGLPLSIFFPSPPPSALIKDLKTHKFKWNTIRNVWEGKGVKKDIEALVNEFKGVVEEI